MPYILLVVEKEKSLYGKANRLIIGGDDGNRTRVRKPIHTTFYEHSLLLTFPQISANRHALIIGSLQYIMQTQALLHDVHR